MISHEHDAFFRINVIGHVSYFLRMECGACKCLGFSVEGYWVAVIVFDS